MRQQENQQLGLEASLVATFPWRLQDLVGYGVYHGLIGHIDKDPPRRLLPSADDSLSPGKSTGLIWDTAD